MNPINHILSENDRRNEQMFSKFDPLSGLGSVGKRIKLAIADFVLPVQYVPEDMFALPFIQKLSEAGSIRQFLFNDVYSDEEGLSLGEEEIIEDTSKVAEKIIRVRCRYDFPFWAAFLAWIKNKGGGDDVLFRLTYPQRILVARLEELRRAGKPIRLILLKARQWGGSTTIQLYMAWLQLLHKTGLNSLIIAHKVAASDEIKDMYDRMIKEYPLDMLHPQGESFVEGEKKTEGVGKSGHIQRIITRNCKIKIGTAESPDSCRGGDYNLVHLSEVGLWKKTDGKTPEDIVRSACSGILLQPLTMIVMESTANGTDNFFHDEYQAASDPDIPSQYHHLFISWFQIEQNRMPFASSAETRAFAKKLYEHRLDDNATSNREEPGRYLWWLWNQGASLEAINWYILERAGRNEHAVMASEYPSDDVEAFVHSGSMVFDKYQVEEFKRFCKPPRFIGDVYGEGDEGKKALSDIRFHEDKQGVFWVWSLPEIEEDFKVTNRYLTVVDVGGRSNKADWSVVVVFDRINLMEGGRPSVVAQWYGHTDIDRLAWKAAQIAAFYDNSLLVIESNTLETHDKERQIEGGDQSHYILNQISDVYPNLYARKQSEEEIRQSIPKKYGFHTNIATKPMVISNLIKVIREQLYTERDKRCLTEYLVYEKKANGSYGAKAGKHDDLLMTRAIGLHICFNEMDIPRIVKKTDRIIRRKDRPNSAAVF